MNIVSIKKETLQAFIDHFQAEVGALTRSAIAAHEAATHTETRAEDKHDTFAIEASYLAAGQSARVTELEAALIECQTHLEGMKKCDRIEKGAWVCVERDLDAHRPLYYLILSHGGGAQVRVGNTMVHILSPNSPLGEALQGLRAGDTVELEQGAIGQGRSVPENHVREYLVRAVE